MENIAILPELVESHAILAYLIILVGLIFEGEFVIITAGILAHLGAINFFAALAFILLGAFGKTVLGYKLGRYIHSRFKTTRFCRYVDKRVHTILPHFRQKPFWSIFLSKFILGANHLVILFSGFERINYRKYLRAEVIATLIWAPGLLLLGYLFSFAAFKITRGIGEFSLIILGFIIIFIILDKVLGWLYGLLEEMFGRGESTENGHKHEN